MMAGEGGITGVETAVILMAFVVTSSSFGYVYMSTSRAAHERLKNIMTAGMAEDLRALEGLAFGDGPTISSESAESIAEFLRAANPREPIQVGSMKMTYELTIHHWLAFKALANDDRDGARHHVEHTVDLLAHHPAHQTAMRELLGRLDQDSLEDVTLAIRGMVQHTSLPNFGGDHNDLYLKLAEASMARGDPAYARHYLDT